MVFWPAVHLCLARCLATDLSKTFYLNEIMSELSLPNAFTIFIAHKAMIKKPLPSSPLYWCWSHRIPALEGLAISVTTLWSSFQTLSPPGGRYQSIRLRWQCLSCSSALASPNYPQTNTWLSSLKVVHYDLPIVLFCKGDMKWIQT